MGKTSDFEIGGNPSKPISWEALQQRLGTEVDSGPDIFSSSAEAVYMRNIKQSPNTRYINYFMSYS